MCTQDTRRKPNKSNRPCASNSKITVLTLAVHCTILGARQSTESLLTTHTITA